MNILGKMLNFGSATLFLFSITGINWNMCTYCCKSGAQSMSKKRMINAFVVNLKSFFTNSFIKTKKNIIPTISNTITVMSWINIDLLAIVWGSKIPIFVKKGDIIRIENK